MTAKKNLDIIDNVDIVVSDVEDKTNTKVIEKNGCIAQVGAVSEKVTVYPIGECCDNLVKTVDDIKIFMKNINVSILTGKVICGSSSEYNKPSVKGVIVVATNKDKTARYVGVTNDEGEYSICVPAAIKSCGTEYSIAAYCCGSCSGVTYEDVECGCTGNGTVS